MHDGATDGRDHMSGLAVAMTGEDAGDDALVAAAQADRACFARIYERYRLPVYRFLRARGHDHDAALDLTAVTFERALVSLHRYRTRGGGLAAWLLRIARNASIDQHRRASRVRELVADDLPAMSTPGPEQATELRLLLAALPPLSRDAIALRYGAGLTAREIGDVLGKRPDAIQKIIERGLMALREASHDHG